MSEAFDALHRANPRHEAGFGASAAAATAATRARFASATGPELDRGEARRLRFLRTSVAGAALTVAVALVASATIGSPGGGPAIENAAAAVKKAATLSAAPAEQSGTAIVRITHEEELWAGSTVRWNGDDLVVSNDEPVRQRSGSKLLVVDGMMYGIDPAEGGWVELGSPKSIDPGSGTTPADYLAAVREDVGGVTLRRIADAMKGLTSRQLDDGSSVYRGTVPAGLIARKTGFKEGQSIRVLPFGYVAHDEAANPASPLDVAVTVAADRIVREITVRWGTWTYAVTYSDLGNTPAPVAPAHAKSLRALRAVR